MRELKLKHLELVMIEDPDYAALMAKVLGYKNTRYAKRFMFVKEFRRIFKMVDELKAINFQDLTYKPSECYIRMPKNIDSITFKAMMSVQALSRKGADMIQSELIAETIARCCFSENIRGDFDQSSNRYGNFKKTILEQPLVDMLAIYRELDIKLRESFKKWEQLFMAVHVSDEDYVKAGGDKMSQFNVINTIKQICNDFNVSLMEAWQVSYTLTQTNSLSKATQGKIQDNMRALKEEDMERRKALNLR